LVEDAATRASAVTREYRLELDQDGPPMLSVFGGKITTFRRLAEDAIAMLAPLLPNCRNAWTATACLPGGDVFGAQPTNRAVLEFDVYVCELQKKYAWLDEELVARYAHAYGSRIELLLEGRGRVEDMGELIVPGLFAAELDYLMEYEWARTAEDVLWRRSKLGLHLPRDVATKIDAWMERRRGMHVSDEAKHDIH
jgi:glycerol-3-phosphate dehydrogenase